MMHEQYNANNLRFDIAVLRLSTPLEFNDYVQPICIPTTPVDGGTTCVAIGWGKTKSTSIIELNILKCDIIQQHISSYSTVVTMISKVNGKTEIWTPCRSETCKSIETKSWVNDNVNAFRTLPLMLPEKINNKKKGGFDADCYRWCNVRLRTDGYKRHRWQVTGSLWSPKSCMRQLQGVWIKRGSLLVGSIGRVRL